MIKSPGSILYSDSKVFFLRISLNLEMMFRLYDTSLSKIEYYKISNDECSELYYTKIK